MDKNSTDRNGFCKGLSCAQVLYDKSTQSSKTCISACLHEHMLAPIKSCVAILEIAPCLSYGFEHPSAQANADELTP